ncbi:MAG: alpha/beta fold hydrolase [Acidobacteria bacterium]|nr:alpha/beta fold hydrolase [Acidobacteriota bacterium]
MNELPDPLPNAALCILRPILLPAIVLMVACSAPPKAAETEAGAGLASSREPCLLEAPAGLGSIEAECGTFEVAEDSARPDGPRLALRYAVLPAVSRKVEPDALVVLAGGPGQAATETYPELVSALGDLNHQRDVLLLDQRGTGGSHPLRCSALASADNLEVPPLDELRRLSAECVAGLDVDPANFTTEAGARDLDELRQALGYRSLDLYGISYGTRMALEYARLFPERVRTMVLDGVVPPDWLLGPSAGRDAQRALDAIFARCAADEACAAAFPDPAGDLALILSRLDREAIEVHLEHPRTAQTVDLRVDRQVFASSLRLLSYSPETASLLPLLLHDAADTGDLRRLAALALTVSDQIESGFSTGLTYAVSCSEDVPFFPPDAADMGRGTYLGPRFIEGLQAVCEPWPKADVPASARQPLASDVPTLLLSGEADPVTPPANAAQVGKSLSDSRQVVAPGMGHGVVARGCIPDLVHRFVESASFDGLDLSCVDDIAAPPFFVDFTGPKP